MPLEVVARADEVPPGGRRLVKVRGRDVVVFNVDGEFFAMNDRCPHQGGSLCAGHVTVGVTAKLPGEYEYVPERKVVRCPWHAWEFDIRTGQSWCDPARIKVRPFRTEVVAGETLLKGPYVAETFEVVREGSYLLLEV